MEAKKLPHTESTDDGSYELRGLSPGDYRLFVLHGQYLPADEEATLVDPANPVRVDIRLTDGHSITGKIVDAKGKPIGTATISARPSGEGGRKGTAKLMQYYMDLMEARLVLDPGQAEASEDGTFRLASLEPRPYDLVVRAPGFATKEVSGIPAGTKSLLVVLDRGFAVRGRVLNPDEEPVGGISVELKPAVSAETLFNPMAMAELDFDFLGENTRRSTTQRDGLFLLRGLQNGRYRLSLRSDEHPTTTKEFLLAERVYDFGDIVLELGTTLSGRVVDTEGKAVDRAEVSATRMTQQGRGTVEPGPKAPGSGRRDDSGSARAVPLRPPGRGEYNVRVAADGYVASTTDSIKAGSDDVEIVLERGLTIRGQVVDDSDGSPIESASLHSFPETMVKTDEEGAFELTGISSEGPQWLGMEKDKLFLRVTHPDYATKNEQLPLADGVPQSAYEIRLTALEIVSGLVLNSDQEPVANARVRVHVPGIPELITRFNQTGGPKVAVSQEDGSFTVQKSVFEFLPAQQKVELVVTHPRYAPGRGELAHEAEFVEVVLTGGSTLEGRVVDAGGTAVAGAVIELRRAVETIGQMGMFQQMMPKSKGTTLYSRSDGSYRVERLEPGSYNVEVTALGYAKRIVEDFEIGEGNGNVSHDFVLDQGGAISGRVIDLEGNPLEGVEVVAILENILAAATPFGDLETRQILLYTSEGVARVKTGVPGAFTLKNLPEGSYTIVARRAGFEAAHATKVEVGADIGELLLKPRAAVEGTVVFAGTLEPVTSFHAFVTAEENSVFGFERIPRTFNNSEGRFLIEDLNSGVYELTVQTEGYAPSKLKIDLLPGDRQSVEVVLVRGARLRGVVVNDLNGEPIGGASVYISATEDAGFQGGVNPLDLGRDTTGDDGAFEIAAVAAGTYAATASHADFYTDKDKRSRVVDVAGSETVDLEFRLKPAGRLRGQVRNLPENSGTAYFLVLEAVVEDAPADEGEPPNDPQATGEDQPQKPESRKRRVVHVSIKEAQLNHSGLAPGVYKVALHSTIEPLEGEAASSRGIIGSYDEIEIQAGKTEVLDLDYEDAVP